MRTFVGSIDFEALESRTYFTQAIALPGLMHSATTLPAPQETRDVVTAGTKAFFAGGSSLNTPGFFQPTDVVNIYDSTSNMWAVAHLSSARIGMANVHVGTKVLFAGGSGNPATDVVDVYDTVTNQWSITHLPAPAQSMTAAAVGNTAFFVRKFDDQASTAYAYDAASGAWSTFDIPPGCHTALTVGEQVIFPGGSYTLTRGGQTITKISRVASIYDDRTGRWSTATMPAQPLFSNQGGIAVGDKGIFLTESNTLAIYDSSTRGWFIRRVPDNSYSPAWTAVGTKLVFYAQGLGSAMGRVYDTVTNRWSLTALPSVSRQSVATATLGTKAVFAGGSNDNSGGNDGSALVDVYDAATGLWTQTSLSEARGTVGASVGARAVFAGGDRFTTGIAEVVDAVDVFVDARPAPVLTGAIVGNVGEDADAAADLAVTIANSGDAALAGAFTVAIYARPQGADKAAPLILLGTANVPDALSPGASARVTVFTVIPPALAGTRFSLLATVGTGRRAVAFASRADAAAPTATLVSAPAIGRSRKAYMFAVSYHDAGGIDRDTFDDDDIVVTGPNGFSAPATLVSVARGKHATTRVAVYEVDGPGKRWDASDDGAYVLHLQEGQVNDLAGNGVPSDRLGSFTVVIPSPIASPRGLTRTFSARRPDDARWLRSK